MQVCLETWRLCTFTAQHGGPFRQPDMALRAPAAAAGGHGVHNATQRCPACSHMYSAQPSVRVRRYSPLHTRLSPKSTTWQGTQEAASELSPGAGWRQRGGPHGQVRQGMPSKARAEHPGEQPSMRARPCAEGCQGWPAAHARSILTCAWCQLALRRGPRLPHLGCEAARVLVRSRQQHVAAGKVAAMVSPVRGKGVSSWG